MNRGRATTVLAAVLFTDIVGSSDLAVEMGDSRWKELLAYANRVQGEFFSPKLGCRVFPPMGFGVDLAALCLN
jgi:hypothetical protein